MNSPLLFYIAVVVTLMSIIGVAVQLRRPRVFLLISVLSILAIAGATTLHTSGLSYPRPSSHQLFNIDNAEVLWADINSPHIYLLLSWPSSNGPRLYSFPYTEKLAEALKRAQETARATNRRLYVNNPFSNAEPVSDEAGGQLTDDNADSEMKFYSTPPTGGPEKYDAGS